MSTFRPTTRRLPPERVRAAIAVAAFIAGVLAPPFAAAQEAPPLNVVFSFEVAEISGLFDSPAAAVAAEASISKRLAEIVGSTSAYWPTRPGSTAEYPQLRFKLQPDGSRLFIHVQLVPATAQPPLYDRTIELFLAGELTRRGFPPIDQLPGMIEQKVQAACADGDFQDRLRDKLAAFAPLGDAAHLSGTAPQLVAVLPLRWDRYCSLASSVFSLEYLQNGNRVRIVGKGTGAPAAFTPEQERFKGVMILPKRWITATGEEDVGGHVGELAGLTPRFFRLEHLEPDPAPCIDLGGAPPSVAP
jgi:hypothetical protein